jgi:O-antigen/teichoic acid export membrane protein
MTANPEPRSRWLAGAGAVAVGTSVSNVLGYALTVVGARLLEPADFGAFSALLAVVIVGFVAALAAQATTARAAAGQASVGPSVTAALLLAVGVGLLASALSPALRAWLHLPSIAPALAVAVSVTALAVTAPALGLSQGRERFGSFAALLTTQNALRVGGGLVAMTIRPTVTSAVIGIAAGYLAAAVIGWVAARPPVSGAPGVPEALRATLASAALLLGFITLTNVDVILARHVLSEADSGVYAVGTIFTKIAFWLPQFVTMVAFPALVDPVRRRWALSRGVTIIVAAGAVGVAVSALLARPLVLLVAGSSYVDAATWVPGFTALGALYALAHLLVYAHLARGDRPTIAVVWASLTGYVIVVETTAETVAGVLLPGIAAATVIVAWGFVRERHTA